METTLYKKVGKRYIKHDDYLLEKGLPQGLYLFYKENYKGEHSAMMNMLHYAKVHDIKEVGKFCDFWIAYEDILNKVIGKAIDNHVKETNGYRLNDLSIIICKALSEIK